jgi:ABC-type bacteriocin/lantibiotic exporter with double-glycine peptidase domain
MLISYSQRDRRWATKVMKPSKLTLGRYGCTTSCIAMASTYFGENLTPANVCDKIKYNIQGLILWETCNFKSFSFWFREFGRKDVNIKNALADKDLIVILQVANGSHWVVCTGYDSVNKTYKIADPWDGARSTMKRYGNSITGASYFKRK